MKDWTAGYVSEIQYTYGYYSELNPLRVKLAFLNNGLKCPKFVSACELGFGQGISTNIHAASSLTTWVGNDFNPSQAAFAQELASFSESKARLCDDSFADFAIRDDLPDFDYIGLHGIWSWINEENRIVIVDFIKKYLKNSFLVWSEKFATDFYSNSNFSKKPFVFIVLMEKFFLYCYNTSGFNSKIFLKHLKRILILGNFYLLNILRAKNLIRDLGASKESQFCNDNGLKEINLFRFFNRKTELLLKNLNNSLKFLERFFF